MGLDGLCYILTRKKVLDSTTISDTKLSRCLNTGDLTALGVGSTLGVGIYVLAGHVAKELAGPSVVVSFLLAAIASVFAGLCYAEFGARVPRAGSAYIYSYVCIGEFVAFIVGWNLILEYIIGSASVSRGVSLYIDTLLNDTLKDAFKSIAPISVSNMSSYFDFLAFCLVFVIGCGLAFGLKQSSWLNNIFTVLNLCVVIFVIAAGAIKADVSNWYILESEIDPNVNGGKGGFFPFGFAGTLKGAATCFFGFVGFDCIATTGEEVQNPKKSIPLAILLSLSIVFLSYFGVSAIITLMVPYYLQDSNAPIPHAFGEVGWVLAKWIVAIGGIFGLLASLFGALFPLPRILYAMASDGLIFKIFGFVSFKYKTPVFGTIGAALLTGVMAACFELQHLINMMSIGTLMAYTVVAASVVVLRYKFEDNCVPVCGDEFFLYDDYEDDEIVANHLFKTMPSVNKKMYENELEINDAAVGNMDNISSHDISYKVTKYTCNDIFRQLFNKNKYRDPTGLSYAIVAASMAIFCLFCVAFGLCASFLWEELANKTVWTIVLLCVLGACMLFLLSCVAAQPKSKTQLSFKVPFVPFIPFISIFINIYLMLMLDVVTWIRFGVWMAIGIPIYLISICLYKRGSNYVTHVQKTSVNGHVKGNLNYAFENMTECRENESFEDNEKVVTLAYQYDESAKNSIKSDLPNVPADIEENGEKPLERIGDATPDSYGEEIIQMLDQVLQEAEDATEVFSEIQFVKPDEIISVESINEDFISNEVNQNVIAIVHQEDDSKLTNDTQIVSEEKPIEKIEEIPEIPTERKSIPKDQSFIPAPPPMNEEFFNNPKTFTKFKTPGLDPSKKNERIHIKMARKSSLDETNGKILTKSELISKLNNLYGNSPKNGFGVSDPKRRLSPNGEVYGGYSGMHRSEPDLGSIIKKELFNSNLSTVPIVLNDESQNSNQSVDDKGEGKSVTKNVEPEEEEEAPMKVEDIKKKLESIFSKTPKMQRTKIATASETSQEIEPKKMDFSNTMKLQRERYENVLKSFEQARNSVDSIEIPAEQRISIPRARISILKSDKADANSFF